MNSKYDCGDNTERIKIRVSIAIKVMENFPDGCKNIKDSKPSQKQWDKSSLF